MRTLLSTAACAALIAGIASAQQSGQDDTSRSVSPDEYFGTQARDATSQRDTNAPLYEEGTDLTSDDSAEALNARQLRDMQRQDRSATQEPSSMADRLRQRSQARQGGQDMGASSGQMSADGGMVMVLIEGLDDDADVYVALQNEAGFAGGGGEYTQVVRPNRGQADATFEGVAAGDYAVAVFQDTDGDGTVTIGRTGPTEPWGFSGDVSGAPAFSDAMFTVDAGGETRADVSVTGGQQGDMDRNAAMRGDRQMRTARGRTAAAMPATDDQDVQSGQTTDRDAMREAMRRRQLGQQSDMNDMGGQSMMSGEPATVSVTVTGTERRGQVYVALQSEAEFAQSGGAYTQVTRVRRGEAEVTFTDVAPGRYAVAAFQDTNRDRELTLTSTGPTEPWGFSGDVTGAPSFDAAAIDVSGDTSADVTLQPGSEQDADEAMMGMPTMDDARRDANDRNTRMGNSGDMDDMAMSRMDGRMGDMDTSAPMIERPRGEAAALVYRRSASLSDEALTARDYLDGELVDMDGGEVAEVKDVIVDPSGTARGVVLASGGLFGLGENYYAVNFDRVSPELDGGDVVLRSALSEDDIERLRDFDYDAFRADKGGLLLASELRGARVMVGESGERARVEDVVMNRQGGVEAIVLDYDDDQLVAPFERVQIGQDGSMMIAGTRSNLDGFPRYEGRPGQVRRRGVLRRQ